MKRNHPASEGAFVYIEQDERNKFKIQSDQLEKIGAQLRGPRHFPIFQSIILPIIITLATLIFTSLFQYVSWLNTVKLQDATDVVTNAERAYQEAADAIGTRQYSMFVFLPTLRELVKAKAKVEAAARARVEAAAKASEENGKRDAESSPQSRRVSTKQENRKLAETYATTVLRPDETKDMEISLLKVTLNVQQQRFANYYKRLKLWNENYDHLLTDVEYALDKPVFRKAGRETEKVSYKKINQINCSNSLTEELVRQQLDPNSLKHRFAGINKCFRDIHNALDKQLTVATSAIEPVFDNSTEFQIWANLDSLLSKENAFRCYARGRIDYYRAQKELSILSVSYVWGLLTNVPNTKEAQRHLENPAKSCDEANPS